MFSVLLLATLRAQALESDVFSIHQSALSHSEPVSFSIAYPKGWSVTQSGPQGFLSDYTIVDNNLICSFWPTNPSAGTAFVIWRSGRLTAQEAAHEFSTNVWRHGDYTVNHLRPVKTSAGDSGYLVESDGSIELGRLATNNCPPGSLVRFESTGQRLQVVSHDYFFHSGPEGSIRIMITTPKTDTVSQSELDRMVLETLRFGHD